MVLIVHMIKNTGYSCTCLNGCHPFGLFSFRAGTQADWHWWPYPPVLPESWLEMRGACKWALLANHQVACSSNNFSQELVSHNGLVKEACVARPTPNSPSLKPRAHDSHLCCSKIFFSSRLSSTRCRHDRLCAHEGDSNHLRLQFRVWACNLLFENTKTLLVFSFYFSQAFSWMFGTGNKESPGWALGQVLCIRDLALFLFLAAYLQGFIKMCWY